MIAAFAKPGWRNAMLAEPGGSKVWTQADGWTGAKQAIAWVFLLSNRADGGPVPYTIITNMPD